MEVIKQLKEDSETLNSKFAEQQNEEHENSTVIEVGILQGASYICLPFALYYIL